MLVSSLHAETGQRGFVITGTPLFLVPYTHATEAIPAALKQLMGLVGDNARHRWIDALRESTGLKLEALKESVATREHQGFATAQSLVAERKGKDAMDRVRALTRQIKQSEQPLLTARLVEIPPR